MLKNIPFILFLVCIPFYSYASEVNVNNSQTEITVLFREKIDNLKQDNKKLHKLISTIRNERDAKVDSNIYVQKVKSLQDENKKLQTALSKVVAQKSYKASHNTPSQISNSNIKYIAQIKEGNTKVQSLQRQLKALNAKYKKLKNSKTDNNVCESKKQSPILCDDDINLLKAQNQSLRDTIKAQSHTLVSADNATKTAERLITENKMLQRKLEQRTKNNKSNVQTASELIHRNNKLQNDVVQRDHYINKMLGMCDNNSEVVVGNNPERGELLRVAKESDGLKSSLDIEVDENSKQLDVINALKKHMDSSKSKSTSGKGEYYKNNISYLEQGIELQSKELGFLTIRNKELNAKIKFLLDEMSSK